MSYEHRDDDDVLHDEVVHPDEVSGALGRIQLGLRSTPEPVVLIIAPAGQVRARPLVRFLCHLPRAEGAHERLRIGLSQDLPRELEIGIEVALRIHVAWIRREVHGTDHRLQLAFDAGSLEAWGREAYDPSGENVVVTEIRVLDLDLEPEPK